MLRKGKAENTAKVLHQLKWLQRRTKFPAMNANRLFRQNAERRKATLKEHQNKKFKMKNFLNSIEKALADKNYYAALFISLCLPDICGKVEYPQDSSSKRYITWFNKYMPQYFGSLSGEDCYGLRCSLLHEGSDNIQDQEIRDVLDHFIFLTEGAHRFRCKNNIVNGENTGSFLALNVKNFCEDFSSGVSKWISDISNQKDKMKKLDETIVIHDPGYVHKGFIKFG